MAGSHVIYRQSFNDGKIVLYQLHERPKRYWICRIKVPGGKGYIYRGSGTSDLYTARRFADDLLDDMKIRLKLGQSVTGTRFSKLVDEYESCIGASGSPTNRQTAILALMKTYAAPYFTKNKITDITTAEVSRFFDWRRANFKKRPPSEATILHESSQFRTFLNWCHRRGLTDKQVIIDNPKRETNRRPHFDHNDWAILTKFLDHWVSDGKIKSGPIYRDRLMLAHYVLILANTGIRVGEARSLKWMDVESEPTTNGNKAAIVLHVTGKTGSREVVARSADVRNYLQRIKDLRTKEIGQKPNRTDAIFCHKDGIPIRSFKNGFNTLIRQAGVEFDRNGDRRTIYSLRHTYATFRLQEGVNHYVLARNMGTSVKMLEQFYGHTSNRAMADELTKHKDIQRVQLAWE